MMAYHNSAYIKGLDNELKEIKGLLKEKWNSLVNTEFDESGVRIANAGWLEFPPKSGH